MSQYLQFAVCSWGWKLPVTAVLTCSLRRVTETGHPSLPYFTVKHARMNHFTFYPKAGLRSLLCGADMFGKIWSANDQHAM